jgi:glycosyltransferase involved in cell wall biosynthesis
MKVAIVAEYYPRVSDPVRGVWSHRQALAARDAGAEVRVLVLHRPLPPLSAARGLELSAVADAVRHPRTRTLDGIEVRYVRYLSPPRPWSYGSWGTWAAPPLRRALRALRAEFPYDLIHAHYASPAGEAVRRAAPDVPLVVSVHGHDVHGPHAGAPAVRAALGHARVVLTNSAGTARRAVACGAYPDATRTVHLGTDLPDRPSDPPASPTLVTVGNLIARKRHEDVIEALPFVRERHPDVRYVVVGDGPDRGRLEALARKRDVAVDFRGALPHGEAVAAAQAASLFVLPSVSEAFGVAYIEAMAAGVPAIGCAGEDGPAEIAAAGGGIELVPPRDPPALADRIGQLLGDPARLTALRAQARETVAHGFTWEQCGAATVEAYAEALRRSPSNLAGSE